MLTCNSGPETSAVAPVFLGCVLLMLSPFYLICSVSSCNLVKKKKKKKPRASPVLWCCVLGLAAPTLSENRGESTHVLCAAA